MKSRKNAAGEGNTRHERFGRRRCYELVNVVDEHHDSGDVNLCVGDALFYSFGKNGPDQTRGHPTLVGQSDPETGFVRSSLGGFNNHFNRGWFAGRSLLWPGERILVNRRVCPGGGGERFGAWLFFRRRSRQPVRDQVPATKRF